MAGIAVTAPEPSEHAPYYTRYISLVSGRDIVTTLAEQIEPTLALLLAIPEERASLRYEPGKWSIRQVVGHLSDTERILSYRALRIARSDKTPMAGFEQDDYVRDGPFENCRLSSLIDEFSHVREATLSLFRHLDQDAWMRTGTANNAQITVRALAWIIAGHELHHRAELQQKYLA
jgi:DinB superfamily